MATLTPTQKALAKAVQMRAELDCPELQDVLQAKALSSARRSAYVKRTTRSDRIADRIAERLETASQLSGLSEAQRTMLGLDKPKASEAKSAARNGDGSSNGKGKSKSNGKATSQADVTVQ